MPAVTLIFRLHITQDLRDYRAHQINLTHEYFDDALTAARINAAADSCYIPANAILASALETYPGQFKVAFAISGTAMALLLQYRPDVIDSFKSLIGTGGVELLGCTYYHSLSALYSRNEFRRQVEQHREFTQELFGVRPSVFANSELIYSNDIANSLHLAGYRSILCEALPGILNGRSVNVLYQPPDNGMHLLLRNADLSDDIAFRFDDKAWEEQPLTAEKFAGWVHRHRPEETAGINLFLDYETFGVHKHAETGIFRFLEELPSTILNEPAWVFGSPSDQSTTAADVYDAPALTSWRGREKESCIFCENAMQNNTLKKIYSLENTLLWCGDDKLLQTWRRLQAAEYFSTMLGTANGSSHHEHQSDIDWSVPAYRNYMNILTDFEIQLIRQGLHSYRRHHHPITDVLF